MAPRSHVIPRSSWGFRIDSYQEEPTSEELWGLGKLVGLPNSSLEERADFRRAMGKPQELL
eukprot:109138-Pleurochrysis_carterae.AAC.2